MTIFHPSVVLPAPFFRFLIADFDLRVRIRKARREETESRRSQRGNS